MLYVLKLGYSWRLREMGGLPIVEQAEEPMNIDRYSPRWSGFVAIDVYGGGGGSLLGGLGYVESSVAFEAMSGPSVLM